WSAFYGADSTLRRLIKATIVSSLPSDFSIPLPGLPTYSDGLRIRTIQFQLDQPCVNRVRGYFQFVCYVSRRTAFIVPLLKKRWKMNVESTTDLINFMTFDFHRVPPMFNYNVLF